MWFYSFFHNLLKSYENLEFLIDSFQYTIKIQLQLPHKYFIHLWRIKLRKAANFTTVKPERKPHCVKFLEFKGPTRAHFCGSYSTIPNEVFFQHFKSTIKENIEAVFRAHFDQSNTARSSHGNKTDNKYTNLHCLTVIQANNQAQIGT